MKKRCIVVITAVYLRYDAFFHILAGAYMGISMDAMSRLELSYKETAKICTH